MPSFSSVFISSSLIALARCHGVILNAQGIDGSPASVGFQVDPDIARNCTTINPCQQDATIIRDAEIKANVVNECGRTSLSGNIDVGENTENALAAGAVTQVKAGSEITVTIHQVNADGAGPYFCDLDESSNSGEISQNLTVTDNVPGSNGLSQAKEQAFNITVKMPDDLNCFGASTGNICTVRCRNNAVAGPFGGCFAVQQVDTEETSNTPETIQTNANLEDVLDQVQQNQADFPVAVQANQNAGSDEAKQNLAAVEALLGATFVSSAAPTETPDVAVGRQTATTPAASAPRPTFTDVGDDQGNDNTDNGDDDTDTTTDGNNNNNNNNNNGNDNATGDDTTDDTNTGNNGGNGNRNRFGGNRGNRNGNQNQKRGVSKLRWAQRRVISKARN